MVKPDVHHGKRPGTWYYHGYHIKNEGKNKGSQRGVNNYPMNQAWSPGSLGSNAVLPGGTGNTLVSFSLSVMMLAETVLWINSKDS